jgi:electron transfer flavoprotein alpha/beta subunit
MKNISLHQSLILPQKINFTNGDSEFDTNGVQYVINPNDEFGLTRAIWFQENKEQLLLLMLADRKQSRH